jgi:hypothetical protein
VKMEKWDLLKLFQDWENGDKGEWWRRSVQIWYIVRTFVNVTLFSEQEYYDNLKKFKKEKKENKTYTKVIKGFRIVMNRLR